MRAAKQFAVLAAGAVAVTVVSLAGSGQATTNAPTPTSVLEQYPGFRFVDSDMDEAAFDREEAAREVLVRDCMAVAGWRYTPTVSVRVDTAQDLDVLPPASPNDDYAQQLAEPQRQDFYLALYGVPDPNSPVQEPGQGCAQRALVELPGVYALYSKLLTEMEQLHRRIADDPAWAVADQAWSECLSSLGHDVATPEDLLMSLDDPAPGAMAAAHDARSCEQDLMAARNTIRISHEDAFARQHHEELEAHANRLASDEALVTSLLAEQ